MKTAIPSCAGAGQLPAVYSLPVGAIIMVKDGEQVLAGDIIAVSLVKPPRPATSWVVFRESPSCSKSASPRIWPWFPKSRAPFPSRAKPRASASSSSRRKWANPRNTWCPRASTSPCPTGDFVECGDLLTEGNPELHDILRTKGEKYLAAYLVDEIQEVYRFQGVGIDDKHIEVIVRQMLRKVTVTEPGGTSFLVGEQVDKAEFKAENQKAMAEGRSPATAEPLVLGITQRP